MYRGVHYEWVKDVYSQYGIRFRERRNRMGTWIDDPELIKTLIDIYSAQQSKTVNYEMEDDHDDYNLTLKLAALVR